MWDNQVTEKHILDISWTNHSEQICQQNPRNNFKVNQLQWEFMNYMKLHDLTLGVIPVHVWSKCKSCLQETFYTLPW